MRVNSEENIFNILKYVSNYSFLASDMHFRKLGQIEHILPIEHDQFLCFSSVLYPVRLSLFFKNHLR